MKTVFITLFISLCAAATAQEDCAFEKRYSITAPSGMRMRAEPRLGTDVVISIPKDSIVEACGRSFGEQVIEDKPGSWLRVRYKGKVGFMFDGFLQQVETPVEYEIAYLTDTVNGEVNRTPILVSESDTITNPGFVWERTERDEMPSTGRLDQQQISALARALRTEDLPMDSVIRVLHALPTRGSQDSLIAWIAAGRPEVYRVRSETPAGTTSGESPTPVPNTAWEPEIQLATEAFNYCGDINELDPGLNWYGVFASDNGYEIRRAVLEIVVSRHRLGSGMEFDIRNDQDEPAHFLIGVNRKLDTNTLYQLRPDHFDRMPSKLFPGQQMETYAHHRGPSAANVFISAMGSVIEVGKCPVIENYKMRINTQGLDGEILQDITPLFETLGDCGMPEMYWYGDLNGDQYPELIYVSPEKNRNVFTLLWSDTDLAEGLYTVGSTWTLENCNK